MALNTLAFPADIQWRRLCVSSDMLVRDVCESEFPPRWRSSIAVFIYEPPEDQQTYPDHVVSYLKVSSSITGIQPGAEVGMDRPEAIAAFNDAKVIEDFTSVVDRYYPCYGAVLEVAVKPHLDGEDLGHVPLTSFPYFIDFEPKKREVIEVVTDTGERMSRSEAGLSVRKGTTTTEGHEVMDTDTWGIGAGVSAGVASLGGMFSSSSSTKDMTGTQHENIRTTDHAREQRESYSHQTQLTQMYHQFTGYHIGTNRAVFFMLPRPHILDREHTFVNGPRQLEGVQDVFLVMMRPKTTQTVCVQAYLETAHLAFKDNVYEQRTETMELPVQESRREATREYTLTFDVPDGWELDTEIGDGDGYSFGQVGSTSPLQQDDPVISTRVVSQDMDQIVFGATLAPVGSHWVGSGYMSELLYDYSASLVLTVHLRRVGEDPKSVPQDLYLTGRGVCCCESITARRLPPGTEPMAEIPGELASSYPVPPDSDAQYATVALLAEQPVPRMADVHVAVRSGMRMAAANRLRGFVGDWLMRSMSSPSRYPRGKVSFLESQLLGRRIAEAIGAREHADNVPVREIDGLAADLAEVVAVAAPALRRADLLRMPLAEMRRRFEISDEQAVTLRRAALGLLGDRGRARRWSAPDHPTVPDLLGLDLAEAQAFLGRDRLRPGTVTEQDSEQPRHTVLDQRPAPGVVVAAETAVDLTVASGLTVRVPDVVGRGVGEALRLLHEAGLRSEPELVFTPSPGRRRHTVIEAQPRRRTFVTPHARVVLRVVEGD